jgi:uncharacterized Zn finger protein
VTYRLKCNHCGTDDHSTRHDLVASRNVHHPHRCQKCGKTSDVILVKRS